MTHSISKKWLIAVSTSFLLILVMYACQKDAPDNSSSLDISRVKSEALRISAIHDSAITYMFNYPGYNNLNNSQRVKIANSFLWINGYDRYDSLKYQKTLEVVNDLRHKVNFKDIKSVVEYLKSKTMLSENALNYIKYSYSVLSMNSPLEDKVKLLENYRDEILTNTSLSNEEKVSLTYYFTIVRGSAINWKHLITHSSNSYGKKNACNDCLANNWGWFAAADGLGGIIVGIFTGGAGMLQAALTSSAATVAWLCPECYEAEDELIDYAPCPNCPSPYVYDGANCWLFTPPSGSNPFIQNGYFYWDDPSHTCNPPGSPAFWDGAHCAMQYKLGTGANYGGFIYNGGFYIKCAD